MPARLKSLELNGYKTFASRTRFEFSDSITVVVGPNGSGKSNIADALRWVLGEQSYSLLRGRKTDDMIFAGSQARSRAGMASASIVFDNSDGWLPIDFSEVSIKRRAYRDGQNEYLINDQKVRLRDVSELLAQSGLAERTYTVIGQGLVDAALSLKADERRRLFEEAAGIGLYRSRKEQALRRLDTTKRNLERAQDILSELKPRLRSLQRQSRRAEQYEEVQAELREVLRLWYGYHWHLVQRELKEARQVALNQEQLREQTRAQELRLTESLSQSRHEITELRTRLTGWRGQLSALRTSQEAASRDLAVGAERRRSLLAQAEAAQGERARIDSQLARQTEALENLAMDETRRQQDLEEAQAKLAAIRSSLQERRQTQAGMDEALNPPRSSDYNISTRKVELRLNKAQLSSRRERYRQEASQAEASVAKADGLLQAAQSELNRATQDVRAAEVEFRQAADDLQEVESRRKTVEERQEALRQALLKTQTQLARREAQRQARQELDPSTAGYAAGAKLLLDAARAEQLRGARGALGRYLEMPAELEKAIRAALGDYVDAVLLSSDGDLDQALDLLSQQTARGALLPIGDLKSSSSLSPPDIDGCLGVASNLVGAPQELNAAVDLLLGDTLVVRDRDAARRVLSTQNDNSRAVTLRGEVFHASGLISFDGHNGQNLPASPHQEPSASIQTLRDELQQLQQHGAALEKTARHLNAKHVAQMELRQNAQAGLEEARGVHRETAVEFEAARRLLAWEQEQKAKLDRELQETQQALDSLGREAQDLLSLHADAQDHLQEKQVVSHSLPLDDFQSSASYWETQAALASHALEDSRARSEDRRRTLEDLKERRAQVSAQLGSLAAQQTELVSRLKELHTTENELAEKITKALAQIKPAEAQLADLENGQDQLQEQAGKTRQAMNNAERQYTEAQIALNRKQEALDSLRHRIEDDFGLVAFEYDKSISGPTPLPFEGLVENLPIIKELPPEVEETLNRRRNQIRRMGSINPEARKEYLEVNERYEFISSQIEDLHAAEDDLREVVAELDALMEREFRKTFDMVASEFRGIFTRLFGGGSARLLLTHPDDLTNTGIDIEAQLPGKRSQRLALLSGGERSLTAAALVFSLIKASPTPFCVLDEVDAMLDEVNVGRFRELLTELSAQTQFLVITHNRSTVQAAHVIYGITMGRDTASQAISLKLDEVDERYSS